jgi:hypothetical protein
MAKAQLGRPVPSRQRKENWMSAFDYRLEHVDGTPAGPEHVDGTPRDVPGRRPELAAG